MIPNPIIPSLRARCGVATFTALLGLTSLAALPAAHAKVPSLDPATVVPSDTFNIELVAYNQAAPSGDFYAIQPGLDPVFGTTQTYPSDALGGQTLTVTSSQTVSGSTFMDTITISVPTNFIPAGTTDNNGAVVNSLEFSIGADLGGTDTLDFNTSLVGANYSGSANSTSLGTISLAAGQNPTVTNSNKSLSNEEALTATPATTSISTYGIKSFTFTIAVPEPSTYATVILGAAGLLWVTSRRNRVRA